MADVLDSQLIFEHKPGARALFADSAVGDELPPVTNASRSVNRLQRVEGLKCTSGHQHFPDEHRWTQSFPIPFNFTVSEVNPPTRAARSASPIRCAGPSHSAFLRP